MPVLKPLRGNGLDVVAIHRHKTGVQPVVIFLHHYGAGPAAKLAQGVRAAVDLLCGRLLPGICWEACSGAALHGGRRHQPPTQEHRPRG